MLDAIVGAVIMVVASTSLLFAVEVVEDAFREAGGYPVSPDEQELLDSLGQSLLERHKKSGESEVSPNILAVLELIDDLDGLVIDRLPKQYRQDNEI